MQTYDVITCSGTVFSCLASAAAARKGARVCLLTPRYSLGDDFTATLAPFLKSDSGVKPDWLRAFAPEALDGNIVFPLASVKKALFRLLDESGVEVRFGRRVVRVSGTAVLASDKDGIGSLEARAILRETRASGLGAMLSLQCRGARSAPEGIHLINGGEDQYALFHIDGKDAGTATREAAARLRAANDCFLPARRADAPLSARAGSMALTDAGVTATALLPAFATLNDAVHLTDLAKTAAEHLIFLCKHNPIAPKMGWTWDELPSENPVHALVCGGGTGGVPAAFAAARNGDKVMLCERFEQLGGISTLGGVNVYFAASDACIHGFTNELDERTWHIERQISSFEPVRRYWNILARQMALEALLREGGVRIETDCAVVGARRDGARIREALIASDEGLRRVPAEVFLDFSGDGDLAMAAGVPYTLGDRSIAGLQTSNQCAWRYTTRLDGVNVDLTVVDPTSADELDRSARLAHSTEDGCDFSEFCAARESRHFIGAYSLTEKDVFLTRRFSDAIVRSDGRFDQHALQSSPFSRMGFLPYHHRVHSAYLPLRCCYSEGTENLLFGGKLISAQRDSYSFFRMQQDIINEGYALGTASALAPAGCVAQTDIAALQKLMTEKGVLLESAPETATPEACAQLLRANDPYGALLAMCLGADATEALRGCAELSDLGGVWARIALTWLGRLEYVPSLLDYIRQNAAAAPQHVIDSEKRPQGGWHTGQCDPYWTVNAALTALAERRVPQLVPLLRELIAKAESGGTENEHVRLHWRRIPRYDRIVSLCQAAKRYADPRLACALDALLDAPWLTCAAADSGGRENEYYHFPALQLEAIAAIAAARCGSEKGQHRLVMLASDRRAVLAGAAQEEMGGGQK